MFAVLRGLRSHFRLFRELRGPVNTPSPLLQGAIVRTALRSFDRTEMQAYLAECKHYAAGVRCFGLLASSIK